MADGQSLNFARKYRPKTLNEYIGNDKLKTAMLKALQNKTRPQAILLSGASGCGKTTFARLIAKEYLCENRDEVTGACDSCDTCKLLDEYIETGVTDDVSHLIRELNIADSNGKSDIDNFIDEMLIPTLDNWKVYIFDEVHMATKNAQNALLKIVEEPPEGVLMIFCTTNPEMMIETLVNRCQLQLRVKKPTVAELAGLLKKVCQTEGVDSDPKGLMYIANRSGLTIRQALSNLERVINELDKADYESAIKVFEEVSDEVIVNFFKALLRVDGKGVEHYVKILTDIKATSDFDVFVKNIIEFTKRGIYVRCGLPLDGISEAEYKRYKDLFKLFTVEQLSYFLTVLTDLDNGDIESKLMALGYQGIIPSKYSIQTLSDEITKLKEENLRFKEDMEKLVDSKIEKILGECRLEANFASKVAKENAEKQIEAFDVETKKLADSVDISDIMEMFPGVETVRDAE